MINAIILLNVQRDSINTVAEKLIEFDEISEVYSVSGNYDLIALVRVMTNESLAELVTQTMGTVDGIEHTETMIAFKTYSRYDLDRIFSVGMD